MARKPSAGRKLAQTMVVTGFWLLPSLASAQTAAQWNELMMIERQRQQQEQIDFANRQQQYWQQQTDQNFYRNQQTELFLKRFFRRMKEKGILP